MINNAHFDIIASQYESSLPQHVSEHYLQKRLSFIKSIISYGNILDVCCGTGAIIHSLNNMGYRAFGVDLSLEMLKLSNQKKPGFQIFGTAIQLPFANDQFDLVTSIAAMHHIADASLVKSAIYEMIRVARPGGYILIWDHNPANFYWKYLMKRLPQDSGEERLIPKREIIAILEATQAALSKIQFYNLSFIPDFIPVSFMKAARVFETILEKMSFMRRLSAHNVFFVQKKA